MRYLDPKNDLTFKKVFGQHPHLLRSFLNALLPLEPGQEIVSLEYLPAELVPELPLMKHTIVDVRCLDNRGRQFIVEMQMLWTDSFTSRVLFNASKAYVKQLDKAREYKGLKPVYALSLVNENFDKSVTDYYHHYALYHSEHPEKKIEGLELIFIELPKFKAQSVSEKKLQVLWLRYLTEIEEQTEIPPEDLMEVPEIKEAIEHMMVSGFSKAELETYDKYWDSVRSERTLLEEAHDKGKIEGRSEGEEVGLDKGIEITKHFQAGKSVEEIASIVGISAERVRTLLSKHGLI